MRIVLDTNIFIAEALGGEFAEDIIDMILTTSGMEVITSEEILSEIQQKLLEKFHWLQERVNLYIERIRKIAEIVDVVEKISFIIRDPKDNKILECAVTGSADLIITIDQDLIKLKRFRGIGIIHPKTFTWTFPEYFKRTKEN